MIANLQVDDTVRVGISFTHPSGIIHRGTEGRVVDVCGKYVLVEFDNVQEWLRQDFVAPTCMVCGAKMCEAGSICCECEAFAMGGNDDG